MTDQEFIQELKTIISTEAARHKLDELQPTDYTVDRLSKEERITIAQARKILDGLHKRGLFIKVKIPNPNGGGPRVAYRPVEGKAE